MKMRSIHSQLGFTLIEILFAVAIVSFTMLGVFSLIAIGQTSLKGVQDYTSGMTGGILGERLLGNYFREATLSYNAVIQTDNSWVAAGTKRSFWDLFSDIPYNTVAGADVFRAVYMTPPSDPTAGMLHEFKMVVNHWQIADSAAVSYDPVSAYSVGASTGTGLAAVSGAVTYQRINQNDCVKKDYPSLWQENAFVAVYSPITVRPVGQPLNVPVRAMQIIGKVQGDDLIYDDWGGVLMNQHPINSGILLNSFDTFFRTIPPVGGGSPHVLIRRVDLIRLSFTTINSRNALVTQTWMGGGSYSAPQVIAMDVKRLNIDRDASTEPLIRYQLIMESDVQNADGSKYKIRGN